MAELHERAKNAENRVRHNNLHLVGLPETLDAPDLAVELEGWLRTWVAAEKLSSTFIARWCLGGRLALRPY
ncbi:hypothetical protein NDU88_005428 [Pleurodeles waltl]|uniref:Uncharacterized protein n=1 Tax=Pleurodeles waltl TaxID=8319 RepID=A0AAV7SLL2_PLEWA|nr:hypothetical protein NDU88_005428 [Pleurodeles waltl]